MAVMVPREKWTDEPLDDLNEKVDDARRKLRKALAERGLRVEEGSEDR